VGLLYLMLLFQYFCERTALLVTVTVWFLTKRPLHCDHLMIYFTSPSEFKSLLIHEPELSGKHQKRHLVAKQGETWREISLHSADEVSLSYSAGIFNIP
jgi:hypothetical protein